MVNFEKFFKNVITRRYWTRRRLLQAILLVFVVVGTISATWTTITFYISAATGSLDPFYSTLHKYSKVKEYDVCSDLGPDTYTTQSNCASNCTSVRTLKYFAYYKGNLDGLQTTLGPLFSFDLTLFWLFIFRWIVKACSKYMCKCNCPKCCSKTGNACQMCIEWCFTILALLYMCLALLFYTLFNAEGPYDQLYWVFSEDYPFPDSPQTEDYGDYWFKKCVVTDPLCTETDDSKCAKYYNLIDGDMNPLNVTYYSPQENEDLFYSVESAAAFVIISTTILSIAACFQNILAAVLECCDTKRSCGPCLNKYLCLEGSQPDEEEEKAVPMSQPPLTPHQVEMGMINQPPMVNQPPGPHMTISPVNIEMGYVVPPSAPVTVMNPYATAPPVNPYAYGYQAPMSPYPVAPNPYQPS